ncbi:galactose-3-O-sulfotransferase 2-like isoform X2 [Branchiostoma floridae x Branchiostoma belcheri]
MMASSTNNKTSTNLGSTTVTTPSSKKPCVRQGFSFLICAVLLVGMTYLSVPSGVINVTSNIVQGVVRPAAYNDTGWSKIVGDVEKQPGGGRCKEKTGAAFVKVHKAGSTTVQCILKRFGYRRHLHFVLSSSKEWKLGWPYLMKKEDYLQPIPGQPFDLLVDHTVYNREIFRNLLPNDTAYLAIVREPYSHLQSAINYFDLRRKYGLPKDDPERFFLQNPAELERAYVLSSAMNITLCKPECTHRNISKTRNLMAYDLGIPKTLWEDEDDVRDYIAQLDRDFLLVLVLEYFDESLVLLKRYMCWQLTDIFYRIHNSQEYTNEGTKLSPELREAHYNWSKADYMLYQHFNRTLWEKVANEGADFYSEVKQFQHLNRVTSQFCEEKRDAPEQQVLEASAWNDRIVLDSNFCRLLNMGTHDYGKALKERYYAAMT